MAEFYIAQPCIQKLPENRNKLPREIFIGHLGLSWRGASPDGTRIQTHRSGQVTLKRHLSFRLPFGPASRRAAISKSQHRSFPKNKI